MNKAVHPENLLRFPPHKEEELRSMIRELDDMEEKSNKIKDDFTAYMQATNEKLEVFHQRKVQISDELLRITKEEHPDAIPSEEEEPDGTLLGLSIEVDEQGVFVINLKDVPRSPVNVLNRLFRRLSKKREGK